MSDQTLFGFARMTPVEYQDDLEQMRLPLDEKPKGKATTAIRLVDCPSCGGSNIRGRWPDTVCHCGATIPQRALDMTVHLHIGRLPVTVSVSKGKGQDIELEELRDALLWYGMRLPVEGARARFILRKYAGVPR